jgi:DNA-binding transcriptional MerR regulator
MKLSALADRTGVPTPTIKFWLREGLVPRAPLKNERTAVYGPEHVERVVLIKVLREEFDAPLSSIRQLTGAIDAGERIDLVLERCQSIATAAWLAEAPSAPDARHHASVDALCEQVGWPILPTLARDQLAVTLGSVERLGLPFTAEYLARCARALEPVATADLDTVTRDGSVDVIATSTLLNARAQVAVLVAVNQLAHTSVALTRLTPP